MEKKILVIMGSPRLKGITNSLALKFVEKIENLNSSNSGEESKTLSLRMINLIDFSLQHCNACDACLRNPFKCPLSHDDDLEKLEDIMKEADAIIVGSPSYFYNVPGIIKDLIDRSRPMKMAKYQLRDKLFSAFTSSGLQSGGHNAVFDNLIHWALIQGMIVVSALGHPVLTSNFPSESGQMMGLKEFRKSGDLSEVAISSIESLAERIYNLLMKS